MAISLRLATRSFWNERTGAGSGMGVSAGGGILSSPRSGGPTPGEPETRRAGPRGPARRGEQAKCLPVALGLPADRDRHPTLGPLVGDPPGRLGQVPGLVRLGDQV